MFTVDIINLFLSVWLKPMLILTIMLSIAKNSFVFSAAASHWFLVCTLFVTCFGFVGLNWFPGVNVSLLPHYFSSFTSMAVSFDGMSSSTIYLAVVVYFLGAIWVSCFQVFGLFEIRSITLNATPIVSARAEDIVERICETYGITRSVRMLETKELESPVMWGHFSPTILLPTSYVDWDEDRFTRVIAHELAHVSRCDWLIKILCKFVCAILWIVPLAWYVANRLEWFAELACDDKVVDSLDCRAEYAEDLLTLSTDVSRSSWVLNFIRSSQLFVRIQHVLDGRNQRGCLERKTKWVNVVVCALLILPISVLHAVPKPLEIDFNFPNDYSVRLNEKSEQKNLYSERPEFISIEMIPAVDYLSLDFPETPRFEEEVLVVAQMNNSHDLSNVENLAKEQVMDLPRQALADIAVPTVDVKGMLPQRMAIPVYPRRAIDRGVEGLVIVQFNIDEYGEINDPKIIVSQPKKIFDRAVLKALKKSKYRPMEIEGQAITIKNVTETYYFKLYESAADKPVSVKRPLHVRIAELDV